MTQSNVNLSQDSDDTQANSSQALRETQFPAQNIEQALDILSLEAENLSDAQQQETAIANVNLLRNLMQQTGVVPMVPDAGEGSFSTMATGDVAVRGMDVASQVQSLGFVEFTTGLINGTFDSVIGATLKQMEAYVKLVGDLAQTLEQFQAANVSDAQISAHLSNRYPDGKGGTSISKDYPFEETTDEVTGIKTTPTEQIATITTALIGETSSLGEGKKLTGTLLSNPVTEEEVKKIRTAIGLLLASDMMSQLRAMAREGMARIVITEGSIRSKLTFKVATTETLIKQASQYRANSLKASVSGYYSGKKWGASASVAYSQLNVSTVNETNYDNMTMSTEIIGEVNIKFKTETFPPITAG